MRRDRVYTGVLDAAELEVVVEALRSAAHFGIVENLAEIDFPPPARESIDIRRWPRGRIFCPAFELRWEQVDGSYRTVFAAESVQPPPGLADSGLELGAAEEPAYYCWRERDPRLGRTLRYRCVPGEGQVTLGVREYRDEFGRLAFWRYTTMQREGGHP